MIYSFYRHFLVAVMHTELQTRKENLNMKHEDFITNYLEYCKYRKELDQKTIKAYRIDLIQFFHAASAEPSREEIERYITDLHKKYKQKTVKRKIASLKAFYAFLEEENLIQETPFRKIKVKFKETVLLPRVIPREEIEQLLNYMYLKLQSTNGEKQNCLLRDLAATEIFFGTGMRVYELSNIAAEDVNLHTGLIRIMGKGGKERYIQIGDKSVLILMRKYYEANKDKIQKCGYFFVNRNGNRYTEQSIRNMLKNYTQEAMIHRNITPHMFRHSFATYLIEEGMDISLVQRILGHSSIRTTQIYINVASKKQSEILQNLHPRNHMKIKGMEQ